MFLADPDVTDLAVRCTGLSKRYRLYDRPSDRLRELLTFGRRVYGRDFWALQDLTLEIPKGCVYGLIGRNGAGKSTALKMLAGRLRPTKGTLVVNGRVSCILELGMGLNPNLTGRQNARILALFLGLDPWRIDEQLERILDFAELGEFVDQPLAHYSSGMKARLSISALTALEPEVLILDEALATGDGGFAAKCRRFVRDLCKSGCTTILVSHDHTFMEEACDQVAWLAEGKLVAQGTPAEVIPRYLGSLGQAKVHEYRQRSLVLRLEALEESEVLLRDIVLEDAAGAGLWGTCVAGDGWAVLQERAAEAGLSHRAMERGWRGVVPASADGLPATRRLVLAAGEAAYLALPISPPPTALPERVMLLAPSAKGRLSVATLIDGERQVIGELVPATPNWTVVRLGLGQVLRPSQPTSP